MKKRVLWIGIAILVGVFLALVIINFTGEEVLLSGVPERGDVDRPGLEREGVSQPPVAPDSSVPSGSEGCSATVRDDPESLSMLGGLESEFNHEKIVDKCYRKGLWIFKNSNGDDVFVALFDINGRLNSFILFEYFPHIPYSFNGKELSANNLLASEKSYKFSKPLPRDYDITEFSRPILDFKRVYTGQGFFYGFGDDSIYVSLVQSKRYGLDSFNGKNYPVYTRNYLDTSSYNSTELVRGDLIEDGWWTEYEYDFDTGKSKWKTDYYQRGFKI